VVEVSPPFDHGAITAVAGAHVAMEILCLWGWTRRGGLEGALPPSRSETPPEYFGQDEIQTGSRAAATRRPSDSSTLKVRQAAGVAMGSTPMPAASRASRKAGGR